MARPLELAFLLANLRAIGLMRESDFQRHNGAIIEVVKKSIYRELEVIYVQRDLGSFIIESPENPPKYDDWSKGVQETDIWKYVVSLFLRFQNEITEFESLKDGAEDFEGGFIYNDNLKAVFDGEELPEGLGFRSCAHGILDSLEVRYASLLAVSREELSDLRKKVDALERQIAGSFEQGIEPSFPDVSASTPRKSEPYAVNDAQITELQNDLVRELRSAAIYDRDGDAFNAGSAKARAAKIESRLRSLGA